MVYRRHSILLILRLLLILAVMTVIPMAWMLWEPGQMFFTLLVVGLILIVLVIELYYFLNRSIRELIQFMEHIRNRDFNLRFNEKESRGLRRDLYRTFNDVLAVYREIRIEKEVQFRFLEHIVELIEIGIIVFDQRNRVVLSNTAASVLTGIPSLRSWEQILKRSPELGATIGSIEVSGRVLFESGPSGAGTRLAIQVSRTRMLEESYSLVAIQDINSMVEQKETGAWIGLLRTLNHEIKNSVTPISSLADTLIMILQGEDGRYKSSDQLGPQNLEDIIQLAETLQQRSKSLHGFIDEYHKLTKIPAPDPVSISCHKLLHETAAIFGGELNSAGVKLVLDEKVPDVQILADHGLIGQVMINLVRNSLDALTDSAYPEIILSCDRSRDHIFITVSDNGSGIDEELMEKIFIPFFTTKAGGSGIGLSLVRQIMRLHGGHVRMTSIKGEGTTIRLVFPDRSDPPAHLF